MRRILATDPDSFAVPFPQASDATGVETIQAFALAFAAEVALMLLSEELAAPVVDVFAAYGCDLTQVTSDPSWIHDGPLVTVPSYSLALATRASRPSPVRSAPGQAAGGRLRRDSPYASLT